MHGVRKARLAPVGAASTTSASCTVGVTIAVFCATSVRATSPTVTTRANGHRIALDNTTVGKSSWVHAIIGREVPADVERNQCSVLFCRGLRGMIRRSLIFTVVDPYNAPISRRTVGYLVVRIRPSSALTETCEHMLVSDQGRKIVEDKLNRVQRSKENPGMFPLLRLRYICKAGNPLSHVYNAEFIVASWQGVGQARNKGHAGCRNHDRGTKRWKRHTGQVDSV